MSPLIARAESILAQLAAIREAATKGEWVWDSRHAMRGNFYSGDGTGSIIGTCGEFRYAPRPQSEVEANARAIVARINGWQADEDLVRGMLFLCCFADETANERLEITGSYGAFDEPGSVEISRGQLLRWCERWEEVLKEVT